MIEIAKVRNSELVPETKEESFGELMGRTNALRRYLMSEMAENRSFYVSGDIVSCIMGFDDVCQMHYDMEKERAGAANTD